MAVEALCLQQGDKRPRLWRIAEHLERTGPSAENFSTLLHVGRCGRLCNEPLLLADAEGRKDAAKDVVGSGLPGERIHSPQRLV